MKPLKSLIVEGSSLPGESTWNGVPGIMTSGIGFGAEDACLASASTGANSPELSAAAVPALTAAVVITCRRDSARPEMRVSHVWLALLALDGGVGLRRRIDRMKRLWKMHLALSPSMRWNCSHTHENCATS